MDSTDGTEFSAAWTWKIGNGYGLDAGLLWAGIYRRPLRSRPKLCRKMATPKPNTCLLKARKRGRNRNHLLLRTRRYSIKTRTSSEQSSPLFSKRGGKTAIFEEVP